MKPKREQPLRLRLLKLVRHPPAKLVKLMKALWKTEAKLRAFDRSHPEVHTDGQARRRDKLEIIEHEAACAVRSYFTKQADTILALHAKECPDCPWDGRGIFAKGYGVNAGRPRKRDK